MNNKERETASRLFSNVPSGKAQYKAFKHKTGGKPFSDYEYIKLIDEKGLECEKDAHGFVDYGGLDAQAVQWAHNIVKIAEENDLNEAEKRQLIIQSLDFEGRL